MLFPILPPHDRPAGEHLNKEALSLWPSEAIWPHRSGSTLAQIMACRLTAPSHYLHQCRIIIGEVLRNSHEINCAEMLKVPFLSMGLKVINLKLQPHISGASEIMQLQSEFKFLCVVFPKLRHFRGKYILTQFWHYCFAPPADIVESGIRSEPFMIQWFGKS